MHELLSKTKFINALVQEHVSIDAVRKERGQDTYAEYLRLDLITPSPKHKDKGCQLVIRGNRFGPLWIILDQSFSYTPEGIRAAYKAAVDIALRAAEKAATKTGCPAQIGMPPVSYFSAWFQA